MAKHLQKVNFSLVVSVRQPLCIEEGNFASTVFREVTYLGFLL